MNYTIPKLQFPKILICIFLFAFLSCEPDPEFDYPLIFTGEVGEISREGATFYARIPKFNLESIREYGFVWNEVPDPNIHSAEKIILHEVPASRVLSLRITANLKKDTKYYVRAFIRDEERIIYGKEVHFMSLGSSGFKAFDFSPKTGNVLDTVRISGENFSYLLRNSKVRFEQFAAPVVEVDQDTIIVLVPEELNVKSSTISVSIHDASHTFSLPFELVEPSSIKFSPQTGTFGSEVIIRGMNFLNNASTLEVFFAETPAEILDIQEQTIRVKVPNDLNNRLSQVHVFSNNLVSTADDLFRLSSFSLTDFNPKIANTGDELFLDGNNFSPILENNHVFIGGHPAQVVEGSTNRLKVIIPLQDSLIYPSRNSKVSVEVIQENLEHEDDLLLNDRWFRLKDARIPPYQTRFGPIYSNFHCFVVNNKAYIGLNNQSEFWEFNSINGVWTKLADFPGVNRWRGNGFSIGNKIYFGTGGEINTYFKDWWEYDILNDTWTQKNDFAGIERGSTVAFAHQNLGYLGTGAGGGIGNQRGYTDFWEYDPATDNWIEKTYYPAYDHWGMWRGIAVAGTANVYMGLGNITISGDNKAWVYAYNPQNNSWLQIQNYPVARSNNYPIGFYLPGKVYIKTAHSPDFYFYDEAQGIWQKEASILPHDIVHGIGFSIGSKGYVGLGQSSSMWEFDPNR